MTGMTRNFLIAAALGAAILVSGLMATDGLLMTAGGVCLLLGGLVGATISAVIGGTQQRGRTPN